MSILTRIPHGTEDALGDCHDGVGGLVVAPNGLSSAGIVTDVLEQVVEGLADHDGCSVHLLQELIVIRGGKTGLDTALHRPVHQLPSLDELFLAHRRTDGGAYHLQNSKASMVNLLCPKSYSQMSARASQS